MFRKNGVEDKAMRGPSTPAPAAVPPAADPEVQRTMKDRGLAQDWLAAATRTLAAAEEAMTTAETEAGETWLASDAVPEALVVQRQRVADARSMLRVAHAAAATAEASASAAWTVAQAAYRTATTARARALAAKLDTHLVEAQRLHGELEAARREATRQLGELLAWPAPLALFSRRATYPLALPEWRRQMQKAGVLGVDPERDQVVYHRMAPSGGGCDSAGAALRVRHKINVPDSGRLSGSVSHGWWPRRQFDDGSG